jgi:PAP2 superfamily
LARILAEQAGGRRTIDAQLLIWALIAAMGAIDCALLAAQGMTVAVRWPPVVLTIFLTVLSVVFQRRNPPAARLFISVAQICAFTYVGSILTYGAMAASPFGLADTLLGRADAVLGFDWLGWFRWVNGHPALHTVLAQAYASIPLQIIGLLVYFAYADPRRVDELLLAGMLSIVIATPIMFLLPAIGAWSQHGVGIVEPWKGDILALRSHTLLTIGETLGIISFPSYHVTLGVLLANMARGRKWFLPILVVNLLLIASVMSEGSHYGVDMVSGLAVAWAAIAASRSILVQCARSPVGTALQQPAVAGGNEQTPVMT